VDMPDRGKNPKTNGNSTNESVTTAGLLSQRGPEQLKPLLQRFALGTSQPRFLAGTLLCRQVAEL
jgi:hypothetical protein